MDVRVVVDALGELADTVREVERLLEVLEAVLLHEVVVLHDRPAAAEVLEVALDLLVGERRDATPARDAFHRREVAGHQAFPRPASSRCRTIASAAAAVEIPRSSATRNTSRRVSPIARRRRSRAGRSSPSSSSDARWMIPPAFTT